MNQLEMFKFACPWKGILWNPNSQVGILLRWLTDSLQFLVLTCIRITSLPFMDCINSFYMKNRVCFKKKKLKLLKVVIRLVTCLSTIHFYNRIWCICSPQHHIFFFLYWCVGWCTENWMELWIVMSPCSDEHVNMESYGSVKIIFIPLKPCFLKIWNLLFFYLKLLFFNIFRCINIKNNFKS